jgi:hypothetical protein
MIIAIAQRQSALDTLLTLLNGGSLKFYSGTRPAALTLAGNTLLSSCPLNATAFGATNSSGVATANAITTDAAPASTGTASFAFAYKSDGVTPLLNLSVGTSGTDVILNSTAITTGGSVAVSSATVTFPAGS